MNRGILDMSTTQTSLNMARDVLESDSGTGFTFSTPYYYSGTFFAGQQGADSVLSWTKVFAVIGPLPYILFGIGLLVYAIGHVRKSA